MTAEEKTEYYTTTTYTMTTSTITVPGLESSLSEDDKKAVQEDNVLAATIELDEKSEIVTAKAEYDENGNHISFTRSKAESSIVYKMDFIFVMPFVAIINFLQFFDKSALNYAAAMGIKTSTHLTGSQFSWVGSIFYLGYLLFQIPSTFLIQKFPIGKYVGVFIVIWGLVLLLTYKVTNFSQLAGLRFLLGFFEAGIYPSCVMVISALYRRSEQSSRIGIIYICNGISMILGGLISYGIAKLSSHGLLPWQWIMIILGAVTIFFGFICFFFMVDNPKAKVLHLTAEQEKIVDERKADNAVAQTKQFKMSHIYESLRESRFYAMNLIALLITFQNSALSNFNTTITMGFGFTSLQAILLTIPSGAGTCIYILIAVFFNRRYGQTLYIACVFLVLAILGLILLIVIPTFKVKLVGLVMVWGYCATFVMLLTAIANNVTGYTKKIFYNCSLMIFYTLGNFIGPFMMVESQAPLYVGGMIGYIVSNALCIVLFLYIRWVMVKNNRERLANPVKMELVEDMTDVENKNFIYRI
ncbi:hypothetical protein G6F46_001090 [Rhizopus delemar]|uniref:Major facilitator superfamily (MFS) profile domain-containing protein n=3 Tax=Rhizopus TaxID=4842 RepID=I1CLW2_RHIO9|nr:hypothetical protein RO3G_14153 [Rhizopus delemar RA 99-880]KAG1454892.1 hypothetical protein G6F55_007366 [Rhizopus delemar]KAG1552525.1 hypothetical protein G6F51_001175 [Rhizopus arrhizus]KAG1494376.1 hypothetical protein G6F54_007917 [Rhizopus delemar]KAG1508452.1 hypothetical protein G6F53_008183 [Rhizopus delemar]|eukprot:EIE89442.1 hypothetical protein RO3G_14153 [Rhizopus delemar RA 99-880]